MNSQRLDAYEQELNKAYDSFKVTKLKGESIEKLNDLKNLIEKCNIIEEFNVEYLKLLKKFEPNNFQKSLQYFEPSLSVEAIKNNFPDEKIDKISALNKFKLLFTNIMKLKDADSNQIYEELKSIFAKFKEIKFNRYKINFQILPLDNIELYLNILYLTIYSNLKERIETFCSFYNYKENKDKIYDEDKNKEIKEIQEKINKSGLFSMELNQKLLLETENLKLFRAAHNNKFKTYIEEFNNFYFEVNNQFEKRFKEIKTQEDINLYEKFVFFLSSYNFFLLDNNYINIWRESFLSFDLEYIKNDLNLKKQVFLLEKKEVFLDNNNKDLVLKFKNKEFRIENFEKYSYQSLILFLLTKNNATIIDDFYLLKYVKLQYLDNFISTRILTEKWQKFFFNVFNSKAIQTLIEDTYTYGSNITINEIQKIINSISFYNFDTTFNGQTFSFYKIFVSASLNKKGNSNKEKIKYYLIMFLAFLHEILGHTFIIIQKFLYDQNTLSPKTEGKNYSIYANERGRESGEYIIVQLFGKKIERLSFNEIWYIFNLENYSLNHKNFTANFKKCQNDYNIDTKIPDLVKEYFEDMESNGFGKIDFDMYYYKGQYNDNNITLFDDIRIICNPFLLDEIN